MNGFPDHLTPGSKLTDVWLAIRDHGASTFEQIDARLDYRNDRGHSNVGPLLHALVVMGVVHRLTFGRFVYYCAPRHARSFQ